MSDINHTSHKYKDNEYLSKNSDWHAKDSPWKAKQILKIINKNNLKLSNICEVGCCAGEILRQLSAGKIEKNLIAQKNKTIINQQ